jgi:hypothetical protein
MRTLKGYEKALGVEHKSTLRTVNNLDALYKVQGRLAGTIGQNPRTDGHQIREEGSSPLHSDPATKATIETLNQDQATTLQFLKLFNS